jgi:hypothetical protein
MEEAILRQPYNSQANKAQVQKELTEKQGIPDGLHYKSVAFKELLRDDLESLRILE